jgi:hypothetical protein
MEYIVLTPQEGQVLDRHTDLKALQFPPRGSAT